MLVLSRAKDESIIIGDDVEITIVDARRNAAGKTVEWYTPKHIFDALGLVFDLDPCSPGRAVVPWVPAREHYTLEDDGLMKKWHGNVWMNPPYGKNTPVWLERLVMHGTGVAFLFSRTDAKWFHRFVSMADAICFVKGRVSFIHERNAAAYAEEDFEQDRAERPGAGSMLIGYGAENALALDRSGLGLTLFVRKSENPCTPQGEVVE